LLTAAYLALNGLGIGVLARGFGMHLSPLAMFTTSAIGTVGIMVPSGPGFIGTLQYFIELALSFFVPASMLVGTTGAFANVMWATQFSVHCILGLSMMASGEVSVAASRR